MLVSRDRISYDNMSLELNDCLAYTTEAGVFGVVLTEVRYGG